MITYKYFKIFSKEIEFEVQYLLRLFVKLFVRLFAKLFVRMSKIPYIYIKHNHLSKLKRHTL